MPLHWLVYRHNNQIAVVIEPGASLIHARMRASLAELDQGDFTEGHELDRKWRVCDGLDENAGVVDRKNRAEAERVIVKGRRHRLSPHEIARLGTVYL